MADEAAAVEGGQSFLWWLLSPLLGLGIFLIPMAVIGEWCSRPDSSWWRPPGAQEADPGRPTQVQLGSTAEV